MAYFDGDIGRPCVEKWNWEKRRVWQLFLRCGRSGKFLFLRKAYHGVFFQDWEYNHDIWLSEEEFLFAKLRDEFNG